MSLSRIQISSLPTPKSLAPKISMHVALVASVQTPPQTINVFCTRVFPGRGNEVRPRRRGNPPLREKERLPGPLQPDEWIGRVGGTAISTAISTSPPPPENGHDPELCQPPPPLQSASRRGGGGWLVSGSAPPLFTPQTMGMIGSASPAPSPQPWGRDRCTFGRAAPPPRGDFLSTSEGLAIIITLTHGTYHQTPLGCNC